MTSLDVTIMGRPYRLACKDGEELALREAVALVDERMSTIRDSGKIKGIDRIAVIAALGIAADYLAIKPVENLETQDSIKAELIEKIKEMNEILDNEISLQKKLL
tara:strand:+ start:706 stop:1020 length:315 start_codon:yes stop_codon:yes gene_type:complete